MKILIALLLLINLKSSFANNELQKELPSSVVEGLFLYEKYIFEAAIKFKLDPYDIASLIWIESGFKKNAKSNVGAYGLTQIMPRTAVELCEKNLGKKMCPWKKPRLNIILGTYYLKYLQKNYTNDLLESLMMYNQGPTAYRRLKKKNQVISKAIFYPNRFLSKRRILRKHFSLSYKKSKFLKKHPKFAMKR
jgi:soluble lytic murein transglycosylase-like protein